MAKKATIKKEDVLNLDNILFKCRDILRQAKNSGSFFEKRDIMLFDFLYEIGPLLLKCGEHCQDLKCIERDNLVSLTQEQGKTD